MRSNKIKGLTGDSLYLKSVRLASNSDPSSHRGNDSREVAPASVYMGDVTLIMHTAADAVFVEEISARKRFKKSHRPENLS